MEKKLLAVAIIAFVMVASLSIAGCTSSSNSSSTQVTDYSSYFNTAYSGGTSMIKQPFTKGTNDRGNDVYKGVTRNSSATGSYQYTTVIELTQSQADAKKLYDQTVAQKLSEGFTTQPDIAASYKAAFPYVTEVWVGQQNGDLFYIIYYNDSNVSPSWLFVTEAGGMG
jgi:hypothetical protein